MKNFRALIRLDIVFIMLINVKMPTVVGILTFMGRINFMLSCVEHGKSYITSGPVVRPIIKVLFIASYDINLEDCKYQMHSQDMHNLSRFCCIICD